MLFTVYHTLEPHSLDITRLPSLPPGSGSLANGQEQLKLPNGGISRTASGNKVSKSAGMPSMGDALLGAGLRQGMDGKHCLVALNIRNVYGVPFEVTLQREAGDDGETALKVYIIFTNTVDRYRSTVRDQTCPTWRNGEVRQISICDSTADLRSGS